MQQLWFSTFYPTWKKCCYLLLCFILVLGAWARWRSRKGSRRKVWNPSAEANYNYFYSVEISNSWSFFRPQNKKRLIFPGKTLPKKKTKKKDLSKLDKLSMNEKSIQEPASPDHQDAPDDVEGERIVRKSTRTSVVVRQAERDAIRAALQATMKVSYLLLMTFLFFHHECCW